MIADVFFLAMLVCRAESEATVILAEIASLQGEQRAQAISKYSAGCRGPNRAAFMGNSAALETLRPVFLDEDPAVRLAGLSVLPCYPPGKFESQVVKLLEDPDHDVRQRAFDEAAHFHTPRMVNDVLPRVEKCAKNREPTPAENKVCLMAMQVLVEAARSSEGSSENHRFADAAAPLAHARSAKTRALARKLLDLAGTIKHSVVLEQVVDAQLPPEIEPLTDEERKSAAALWFRMQRRKD